MNATEQGLLADILEHPEDDFPRLACADWLEDHGQSERAEFIRVQVELAGLVPLFSYDDHPRAETLRHRERILWDRHWEEWRPLPCIFGERYRVADGTVEIDADGDGQVYWGWRFKRGFAASVHAPLRALLDHLPEVVARHPVESVRATDRGPEGELIAGNEYWCGPRIEAVSQRERDCLPPAVCARLSGQSAVFVGGHIRYRFASRREYENALSRALLVLAREEAEAKRMMPWQQREMLQNMQNPALPDVS